MKHLKRPVSPNSVSCANIKANLSNIYEAIEVEQTYQLILLFYELSYLVSEFTETD